ncbi:MAG: class I SAM-dependent methyltransferase [Candidatus Limnocylindria bacterium]
MSFVVSAVAYDRFMGRYSTPLAGQLADFAGVQQGQRALDVGCGPGALTGELVARLGPELVVGVDPSEPFVVAARERHPGVEVRQSAAEDLPFSDGEFDVTIAQLVVHFMADPVIGLREMARVTRPGGIVAACVWDHAGGRGPLSLFWTAVRQLDPDAPGESSLAGARKGHLAELFTTAGLDDVDDTDLAVQVDHASFEDWWEPHTFGVGPAGAYVAGLNPARREELRERSRQLTPAAPFTLDVHAWAARGRS